MADGGGQRPGVALVIGVGAYPHPGIPRLQFAAADAEAVADLLADPDVCDFPADRVAVLTDDGADRDAIVRHLSAWLPDRAKGAEIVVLYLAGHGTARKVGDRDEGYFLPFDADPDHPAVRGVALADIARWVEGLGAEAVVICLDCCHAGAALTRRGPEPVGRDLTLRPTAFQAIAGRGRFLLAACDEGQSSVEVPALRHGLFTHHLLKGLTGEGDRDGDGRVGVAELFEYVAEAVARDARALGTDQRPWNAVIAPGGVYLSAPRRRGAGASVLPSVERLRQDEGPAAAVAEAERQLATADEPTRLALLRRLGRVGDPAAVPAIFSCLTHPAEAVREAARRAYQAIGVERTFAAVADLAPAADADRIRVLLDGLGAFEARADLVALLDRLVDVLRGDARVRAHQLLEKKRLSLGLETMAGLFRANHSQYRLQKVLGQGLFTAAFLARDELAELDVVVRVLRAEFVGQPEVRHRFLEQCKRALKFHHQNLARTLEVRAFPDQRVYYIVRDHLPGVTLQEMFTRGGRLDPRQAAEVLRQVAAGLAPLHQARVGHGGVKPSNIFLCPGDRVVLGDVCLPAHGAGEELTRRLAYDYRYAAPEVLMGADAGPAADLYALGCVAFELFCGEPPFVADHPNELVVHHATAPAPRPTARRPDLPPAADDLVLRLLEKAPAARPDLAAVGRLFDRLAGELAAGPADPSTVFPTAAAARPPGPRSAAVSLLGPGTLERYRPVESVLSVGASRPATFTQTLPADGPADPLPDPRAVPGYEIVRELGRGGMGVVYEARDIALGRPVAIKMISAGPDAGPTREARFTREARAVAALNHPNIIQIYQFEEHSGVQYLVLEFAGGGTLADRLRSHGPVPPAEAARLVETVAGAVQYAHDRRIIHRDLKPGNVLLTADGTPKVSDFGLAKVATPAAADLTVGERILGTPAYMAPEQARGDNSRVGPWTDVYALGAMLYELLTGRRPFGGESPMETLHRVREEDPPPPSRLNPAVPADLETIVLKCLEKDPADRYQTAEALAADLARFRSGEAVEARPAPVWQRVKCWWKGRGRGLP